MSGVSRVGQTVTTANAVRSFVDGFEHFGGSHESAPIGDGVGFTQNAGFDLATSHVSDESVEEEFPFVFGVESVSVGG